MIHDARHAGGHPYDDAVIRPGFAGALPVPA